MKTLVRYGEIHLKSDPVKRHMLNILKSNIKNELNVDANIISGRLKLENYSKQIKNKLKRTFGVISFSPCKQIEKDIEKIKKESKEFFKDFKGTFAIRAKRSDKSFPSTSKEIENIVGEKIVSLGPKVDLDSPDKTLFIEIRDKAYLYTKIIDGPKGMPLGTGGCVNAKTINKKDLLACWFIMKRGVEVVCKGEKKLIDGLKKWSIGRSLPERCENKIRVSGENNVNKIKNNNNLYPLVGLTDKEINKKLTTLFF